jgi:hypothetical protein
LSDIEACVAMHDAAGQTIGVWWDDVATLDPEDLRQVRDKAVELAAQMRADWETQVNH